jgi:transposase
VLAESDDQEEIIARVAALDIGKAELVCCVRLPAPGGRRKRLQEVSTHSTMTSSLTELASHLVELRVQRVVMEATSDYWKPVFYLLEAHGLDPWLVNARDVKHLPGRPRPMLLTRFGCASWPSARCYVPASCRQHRFGGCGI